MTLKEYRGNKKLRELAKEFGCSISALSKYEHGQKIQCVEDYIIKNNLPIEINESDSEKDLLKKEIKQLKEQIANYVDLIEYLKSVHHEQNKIIKEFEEKLIKLKNYVIKLFSDKSNEEGDN